jgi:hypothetical protein
MDRLVPIPPIPRVRKVVATIVAAVVIIAGSSSVPARAEDGPFNLKLNVALMNLLVQPTLDPLAFPPGKFKAVKPQEFDPGKTSLVQSAWLHGIGCPTNGFIAIPNADFTGVAGTAPYQDTGCPTGDPGDTRNEGLLLVKTGPTNNFASATAELINVKGMTIVDLGYDIRKPIVAAANPAGSHCGAGAPRFNVITDVGFHFIGCNSPPGVVTASSNGWVRLRWSAALAGIAPTEIVRRIVIIYDEGQDTGPEFIGAAILDNIYLNGQIVGRGAVDAN